MLISPSSLLSAYANPLNYGISNNIDLKDLKMLGSLSFEKGKIELKVESYTENTELKALNKSFTSAALVMEKSLRNCSFSCSTL